MMRRSKEARVRFVKMSRKMVLLAVLLMGVAGNLVKGEEKELCPGMKLYGVCLCEVPDNTRVDGTSGIIGPPNEHRHECPTHEQGFCSCFDPHDGEFGILKGDDNRPAAAETKRPAASKKKDVKGGQSARARNAERRRQRQRRQERKKARLLDEIEMALELKEFELADELLDELEDLGGLDDFDDFDDLRDDRDPDSRPWWWPWRKPVKLDGGDSRI